MEMMAHMMTVLFARGANGGHTAYRTGDGKLLIALKGHTEGGIRDCIKKIKDAGSRQHLGEGVKDEWSER